MITISNQDRDFIIRYIEEMNATRAPKADNREYNLHRMAKLLARRLKAKKSITQK